MRIHVLPYNALPISAILVLGCMVFGCSSNPGSRTTSRGGADNPVEPSSEGDVSTLYVSAHRVMCMGMGPRTCALTRTSPTGEWSLFYDEIQGITLESGTAYELRVRQTTIDDPPADGSSIEYALVEIVSQQQIHEPVTFVPGERIGWVRIGATVADLETATDLPLVGGELATTTGERDDAYRAGPFEIRWRDGAVERVSLRASDAGPITIGERTLEPGSSLQQYVAAVPSCELVPRRGGTLYQCAGAQIESAGPTAAPETIVLVLTRLEQPAP
jgi:hypothetical protein